LGTLAVQVIGFEQLKEQYEGDPDFKERVKRCFQKVSVFLTCFGTILLFRHFWKGRFTSRASLRALHFARFTSSFEA